MTTVGLGFAPVLSVYEFRIYFFFDLFIFLIFGKYNTGKLVLIDCVIAPSDSRKATQSRLKVSVKRKKDRSNY